MAEETIHATQRSFRHVLDAFAFPGSVRAIEPYAPRDEGACFEPCFEMALRLFVDQAVSFAVVGRDASARERWVVTQTHARRADVLRAEYVFVPDDEPAACREALSAAFGGTLLAPERGAFVAIACHELAERAEAGLYGVRVSGPGVDGTRTFWTSRLDWLEAREERADEYPCGVELLFVAADGRIVALPRTSRVECLGVADGAEAPAAGRGGA